MNVHNNCLLENIFDHSLMRVKKIYRKNSRLSESRHANNLTPGATVLYQRPNNSVVELTKLDVNNFELENREVAELIGLELARLIVDTCYLDLMREREETERVTVGQSRKSPYRR